jgi:glycosyltransferase involved in cell wall biosynthesis
MIVDPLIFNGSLRKFNVASKPMLICVSNVCSDLRLDDFCSLVTTGTKILVGEGPYLDHLKNTYSDVHFVPARCDERLAHYYANADVLVCPNGLQGNPRIIPQAICCGTPIATRSHFLIDDLIIKHVTGEIMDDLSAAINRCLDLERDTIEQLGHLLFSRQNNLISHL